GTTSGQLLGKLAYQVEARLAARAPPTQQDRSRTRGHHAASREKDIHAAWMFFLLLFTQPVLRWSVVTRQDDLLAPAPGQLHPVIEGRAKLVGRRNPGPDRLPSKRMRGWLNVVQHGQAVEERAVHRRIARQRRRQLRGGGNHPL